MPQAAAGTANHRRCRAVLVPSLRRIRLVGSEIVMDFARRAGTPGDFAARNRALPARRFVEIDCRPALACRIGLTRSPGLPCGVRRSRRMGVRPVGRRRRSFGHRVCQHVIKGLRIDEIVRCDGACRARQQREATHPPINFISFEGGFEHAKNRSYLGWQPFC